MRDDNRSVTKGELKEVLKDYPTKKDLKVFGQELKQELHHDMGVMFDGVLEALREMREESLRQNEETRQVLREEFKSYTGVLIEDAEERFLKSSHDQVSAHGNRIDNHEGRIEKLETAVF